MLEFSELKFFEFSNENSYIERIRTVRMVRIVRSLADRTFQPRGPPLAEVDEGALARNRRAGLKALLVRVDLYSFLTRP